MGTPEIPSPSESFGSAIAKISASVRYCKKPKPVFAGGVNFENVAPKGICSGVYPGKALFCSCGPPKCKKVFPNSSAWPKRINVVKGCPFPSPAWQLIQLVATNVDPKPVCRVKTSVKATSPFKNLANSSFDKPSIVPSKTSSSAGIST